MSYLHDITAQLRAFRDERDWKQFHNPKELAMSISIEANELLEHFLWKTPEQCTAYAASQKEAIAEEMADVGKNLLIMAHDLGIDLVEAMEKKLTKDMLKYPAERVKGKSQKYMEYSAA